MKLVILLSVLFMFGGQVLATDATNKKATNAEDKAKKAHVEKKHDKKAEKDSKKDVDSHKKAKADKKKGEVADKDSKETGLTRAKQALVVDVDTNTTLFAKEETARMFPASMTKMLSVYIAFEDLKAGKITEQTIVKVSPKAHKMEGSKMFIAAGEEVPLGDLLKGIIVVSGNDASVALAEALAGSETEFAKRMNATAEKLGMKNSHFINASGLPDPNHYTTARDLFILAKATIDNFPEYYQIYAIPEFTWNNITQQNRNPILQNKAYKVDGLKTGHTDVSGFGITTSAVDNNDGRRVIVILHGMKNASERARETEKVTNWAMQNWSYKHIIPDITQPFAEVAVKDGKSKLVKVGLDKDVKFLVDQASGAQFDVKANYNEPAIAPIKRGQELGTITITSNILSEPKIVPLVALEDVEQLGLLKRIWARIF